MDRRRRVPQAQAPRALGPAGRPGDRRCSRSLRRAECRRARDGPRSASRFLRVAAITKGVTMSEIRGNGETELRDRPAAELLKQLSEQTATLVRQELDLAKAELTVKGKRAGVGAGMFGGAGLFAALIVTAVYGAVAGVLALAGKNKVQAGTPPVPEQTVDSVKEDVRFT